MPINLQSQQAAVPLLPNIVRAFFGKIYFNKTELEKALTLTFLFSIGVTLFRILYTRQWDLVWLNGNLFLAIVPYLITNLFHLQQKERVPYWFDLALIFSFAWNGILLGAASIRQMEKMITVKWQAIQEWQFVYPLMLLNALGIYIGRYLRYNSWDVVANPFQLTEDLIYLLIHPVRNRLDWSMIICYAVFMSLIYVAIKRMSKALW